MATILARIANVTIEELRSYKSYDGSATGLYSNLRVDGPYIVGDLREDAFAHLPAQYALIESPYGYGRVVVDAHKRLLGGEDLPDPVIRWGNDRYELEAGAMAGGPTRSGGLPTAKDAFDYWPGVRQPLQQREAEEFGGVVLAVDLYSSSSKQSTKGTHVQGLLVAKGGKFFWLRLKWHDWTKSGRYDPRNPDYNKRMRNKVIVEPLSADHVANEMWRATYVATPREMFQQVVGNKFLTFSHSWDRAQAWQLYPPFDQDGPNAVIASVLREASELQEASESEDSGLPAPIISGVVKWFNGSKGYGFITPERPGDIPGLEPDKDLFVHISNVEDAEVLAEGQEVTFQVREGQRGPEAYGVKVGV